MGLSKLQLQTLGAEANKAFAAVPEAEKNILRILISDRQAIDDPFACPEMVKKTLLMNEWRHRETARALSHKKNPPTSFKNLSQADYAVVLAHFVSFYDAVRGCKLMMNAREQSIKKVLAMIDKSCRERNLNFPGYPESICRDQFRCGLDGASERQLWCIFYTVQNRRKKTADVEFNSRTDYRTKFLKENN